MSKSDHEQFVEAIAALKKIRIRNLQHRSTPAHSLEPNHHSPKVSAEEYLSYKSNGIGAKTFAKLKKGQCKPQASIDLHGKTKLEAEYATHDFIANCQRSSIKYALIIHGKGSGSPYPVLKNHIANLLKNSTEVLAFCSAKPENGGTGALYLLLKRKNHE